MISSQISVPQEPGNNDPNYHVVRRDMMIWGSNRTLDWASFGNLCSQQYWRLSDNYCFLPSSAFVETSDLLDHWIVTMMMTHWYIHANRAVTHSLRKPGSRAVPWFQTAEGLTGAIVWIQWCCMNYAMRHLLTASWWVHTTCSKGELAVDSSTIVLRIWATI